MASDTRKDGDSPFIDKNSSVSQQIQPDPDEEAGGIKFRDWGFHVEKLFQVAYRFYKRNESKAFHLSFDERNRMNALILQARFGNFDSRKTPDIGTLDFVGKNRHYHWSQLSGMSKTEAMSNFICNLDQLCPFFKAHAEAVKISSENGNHSGSLKSAQYDSSSSQNSSMTSSLINQSFDNTKSSIELNEQLKAIHTSLCKQTYEQFRSYAKKEHPNDLDQQKSLISALQEHYYQQYISKMHPELSSETIYDSNSEISSSHSPATDRNGAQSVVSEIASNLNRDTENNEVSSFDVVIMPPMKQDNLELKRNSLETELEAREAAIAPPTSQPRDNPNCNQKIQIPLSNSNQETMASPSCQSNQAESQLQQQSTGLTHYQQTQQLEDPALSQASNLPSVQIELPLEPMSDPKLVASEEQPQIQNPVHQVDTWDSESSCSSGPGSPLKQSISYEPLEPATTWTKRGVCEFKESLMDDKQGGAYTVPQGVVLMIEVPTYPDGRYIHWEFATDDYDIGFGVDFVFEARQPGQPLAMNVYECDDEDEDDDLDEDEAATAAAMQATDLNSPFPMDENGASLNYSSDRVQSIEEGGSGMSKANAIRLRALKIERENNTISILPTYRRDSHEEVYVGRHKYPGQGFYLLKFDNTYSMMRSKSLFYRICYFI